MLKSVFFFTCLGSGSIALFSLWALIHRDHQINGRPWREMSSSFYYAWYRSGLIADPFLRWYCGICIVSRRIFVASAALGWLAAIAAGMSQ